MRKQPPRWPLVTAAFAVGILVGAAVGMVTRRSAHARSG